MSQIWEPMNEETSLLRRLGYVSLFISNFFNLVCFYFASFNQAYRDICVSLYRHYAWVNNPFFAQCS